MRPRPVIHGRDHSHGGPDPAYHAWDDVGTSGGGGGGSGGITDITSADGSVTVTNPTGPTVDLSVPAGVARDREILSAEVTIAGNNFAVIPFAHAYDSALTNLATPTAPKVLKAGYYAVTANMIWPVSSAGLTKYAQGRILVSHTHMGSGVIAMTATPFPFALGGSSGGPVDVFGGSYTYYLAAGDTVGYDILNGDTAAKTFDVIMWLVYHGS